MILRKLNPALAGITAVALLLGGAVLLLRNPGVIRPAAAPGTGAAEHSAPAGPEPHHWGAAETDILASLWLENLPPLPPDPSNAVADDEAAVKLGHALFFERRLSANARVSCATCHQPARAFTDGLPQATGGMGVTDRRTMTIVGAAYGDWMFWDGRSDSQWAQALGPMESAVEHGGNRTQYAHLVYSDGVYRRQYEALFGPLPDLSDAARFPASAGPVEEPAASIAWQRMTPADRGAVNQVYANMGKAIAAYERRILPGPSRFDDYVAAAREADAARMREVYTESEARGLHLFIGEAGCINCHNGPLLTNNSFHNTGVPQVAVPALPGSMARYDLGRMQGIGKALDDEFNCRGEYSDAGEGDCAQLRFARTEGQDLVAAFKTPTLRNVARTAPYMHAGQFATLSEVLDHYNRAPAAVRGHSELAPLGLTAADLADLEAFLRTLSGPLDAPPALLAPPAGRAQDPGPEI